MNKQKGFTLIELLVVIAILGILSTLAVVSLQNARTKGRDARRVSDVKQIQTALELYYNDQTSYPVEATAVTLGATGQTTLSSDNGFSDSPSGTTYVANVPTAPTPADGSCTSAQNNYSYTSADGSTYTITYCLGGATGGLDAGTHTATPAGIDD